MTTDVGAQLAPALLTTGLIRLRLGTHRVVEAAMVEVSTDVAEIVADTRLLADKVRRMTTILERETDTALLAISGWGARIPRRFGST